MKITVLQWNVWYQEKAENTARALREFNADILCLQELTDDSYVKNLGYYGYHETTLHATGKKLLSVFGNGIFSKTPLKSVSKYYTQKAAEDRADKEDRLYIQAETTIKGKRLSVGTVQLSWTPAPDYPNSDYKRLETKNFADFLASTTKTRFLLAGDFNAPPGSETINRFDDLFVPAGPDYSQPTWTTKPHDFGEFKTDDLKWRLDYVYVTADIKVASSRIVPTEYSDHLPILTEIELD